MRAGHLLRAASNAAGPSKRPPPPPPPSRSPLPNPIRKSLQANAGVRAASTPPASTPSAKAEAKEDDSQKSLFRSYMALDWKSRLLLGGILLAFAGITKALDGLAPEEKLETVLDRGPSKKVD